MKQTAASVAVFFGDHGRYPRTLRELIEANRGCSDYSWKCSAGEADTYFLYHEPPEDASPDFVFLECPNHVGHQWRLRHIGVEQQGRRTIAQPTTTPTEDEHRPQAPSRHEHIFTLVRKDGSVIKRKDGSVRKFLGRRSFRYGKHHDGRPCLITQSRSGSPVSIPLENLSPDDIEFLKTHHPDGFPVDFEKGGQARSTQTGE